jgi:hypothetical protein
MSDRILKEKTRAHRSGGKLPGPVVSRHEGGRLLSDEELLLTLFQPPDLERFRKTGGRSNSGGES